ncbi:hypothetical protein BSLG_008470 [Batrachochytrium salamandrivorans]|nr:hypothetical protein BASA60_010146 [Batrachochytrium salamandrivorans]KAH9276686.1 hypothetical protein BASA83_000818 [Batrachochytrium salamandrivorans]KAJ1332843.1 hypothetical protein BSLG_008470 [Batrachochytrium salamandrivorans]
MSATTATAAAVALLTPSQKSRRRRPPTVATASSTMQHKRRRALSPSHPLLPAGASAHPQPLHRSSLLHTTATPPPSIHPTLSSTGPSSISTPPVLLAGTTPSNGPILISDDDDSVAGSDPDILIIPRPTLPTHFKQRISPGQDAKEHLNTPPKQAAALRAIHNTVALLSDDDTSANEEVGKSSVQRRSRTSPYTPPNGNRTSVTPSPVRRPATFLDRNNVTINVISDSDDDDRNGGAAGVVEPSYSSYQPLLLSQLAANHGRQPLHALPYFTSVATTTSQISNQYRYPPPEAPSTPNKWSRNAPSAFRLSEASSAKSRTIDLTIDTVLDDDNDTINNDDDLPEVTEISTVLASGRSLPVSFPTAIPAVRPFISQTLATPVYKSRNRKQLSSLAKKSTKSGEGISVSASRTISAERKVSKAKSRMTRVQEPSPTMQRAVSRQTKPQELKPPRTLTKQSTRMPARSYIEASDSSSCSDGESSSNSSFSTSSTKSVSSSNHPRQSNPSPRLHQHNDILYENAAYFFTSLECLLRSAQLRVVIPSKRASAVSKIPSEHFDSLPHNKLMGHTRVTPRETTSAGDHITRASEKPSCPGAGIYPISVNSMHETNNSNHLDHLKPQTTSLSHGQRYDSLQRCPTLALPSSLDTNLNLLSFTWPHVDRSTMNKPSSSLIPSYFFTASDEEEEAKDLGRKSRRAPTEKPSQMSGAVMLPLGAAFEHHSRSARKENRFDLLRSYARVFMQSWWPRASIYAECLPGRGINEEDALKPVVLVERMGRNLRPTMPKRSIMSLLECRSRVCETSSYHEIEQVLERRISNLWKPILSYKHGSGNITNMQFSPTLGILASTHLVHTDMYNKAGNFLCCDVDLKGWADGNANIVRQMTDSRFGVEGFAHVTSRDGTGSLRSTSCSNVVLHNHFAFTASVETRDIKIWDLSIKKETPVVADEPRRASVYVRLPTRFSSDRPYVLECKPAFPNISKSVKTSELDYDASSNILSAGSLDGTIYSWKSPASVVSREHFVLRDQEEIDSHLFRPTLTIKFGSGITRGQLFAGYEQPYNHQSMHGLARLWDMSATRRPVRTFDAETNSVSSIAWCTQHNILALGVDGSGVLDESSHYDGDRKIRFFDVRQPKMISSVAVRLVGHEELLFSPCGTYLAVSGRNNPIQTAATGTASRFSIVDVIDVRNMRKSLARLDHDVAVEPAGPINSSYANIYSTHIWTRSGLLITGGTDFASRIWDVRRSDCRLRTLDHHDGTVVHFAISADDDKLAVGTDTSHITVYSIQGPEWYANQFQNACAKGREAIGVTFPI